MKISYIIPHKNRTDLFRYNLISLAAQTQKDIEIIVVDNSSAPHQEALKGLVSEFRGRGLDIRVFFVDPSRHPLAHSDTKLQSAYNPAYSINLGVKQSSGDIIVLTSPEVVNASTNAEIIAQEFTTPGSRFLLGWMDELPASLVAPHINDLSVEKLKALCKIPGNAAMCRDDVPHRPWKPENYFLGILRKSDFINIGGIDERFMGSIAYEDNFFAHCCEHAGFPAQICTKIAGIHLSHSRAYQADLNNSNKTLWNDLRNSGSILANNMSDWDSNSLVISEF